MIKRFVFLALGIFLLQSARAEDPKPPLASATTEELIAKLQEESNQGIGSHTTAWAEGFMAIDEVPKFRGGIIGSAAPVLSPVMRELARRGVSAMPVLLDHLSDARPTKLVVGKEFMGKWQSDEYDARYRDAARQPTAVNVQGKNPRADTERTFNEYTVKVGDLCFVAVGQIVNRELNAVRYQPSMCLVVNSPIATPALATAVKADWSGLTAADHQASLEKDAFSATTFGRSPEALKRLLYYYPDAGTSAAVRLLNRPFSDASAGEFVGEILFEEKDAGKQDKLMSAFRKSHSEADYATVEWGLISWANDKGGNSARQALAKGILDRLFPGVNPADPPSINAVDFNSQKETVEALATFHSKAIDAAVLDLLKRVKEAKAEKTNDVFGKCELAHAAILHLTKPAELEGANKAYQVVMTHFPKPSPTTYKSDPAQLSAFTKVFQVYLEKEINRCAPQ